MKFADAFNTLAARPLALLATGTIACAAITMMLLSASAIATGDKQDLKVPNGLAFSELKGYESWQLISISEDHGLMSATVGNKTMIDAFRAGAPRNGKPFPDGAKMAKIHWTPQKLESFPAATVPGAQHDVDFMVRDGKRFADSGGWGYAVFEYDVASGTFRPGTQADSPPQSNDAKCGFACHTAVKNRDYVFTDYRSR